MVFINSTKTTSGFFGFVVGYVSSFISLVARYRVYHRTVKELQALSSHELQDIGLSRAMIPQIARKVSAGK